MPTTRSSILDLAKTTILMHSSLLTLLVLAGLLQNLGDGVSILHYSGLHTIVFIWSKPLLGKRPICYLTYTSSSASLLCWILRRAIIQWIRNYSICGSYRIPLYWRDCWHAYGKACQIHLRERSQQICISTENSQTLAGSCKKFISL